MKKTLLFDLDGTLLNTLDDLTASVNHALAAVGLPQKQAQEVRRYLGNGIRVLVASCVPDGEENPVFEACFAAFRAYYDQHCLDTTRPYPGVPEVLSRLKSEGYAMALVTNKVDSAAQQLWRDHFSDTLELAIGAREGVKRKPDAEMPLLALRALGGTPEQCVYIGDSEVDFATARNAGLRCVLVTWGFRDREELLALGADAVCDEAEKLPEVIEELLG